MAADNIEIAEHVLAHVRAAVDAVQESDIERVVQCLAAGVALYEQHPSCVHEPASQLRELLMFIRAARSLSKTLKREDEDLRELEERAEALRQSALH